MILYTYCYTHSIQLNPFLFPKLSVLWKAKPFYIFIEVSFYIAHKRAFYLLTCLHYKENIKTNAHKAAKQPLTDFEHR